ncbi:phosphoribosyl-ATP diphosphatase [Parasphingopyxis sp.]|uniref:phosphoribosyl-ATP diphosphatase n=1 Tax=Parasphingopyxis sp. TaxID=1920299 RepID=UPI0026273697|nr:phosphoribosyl-ATP diphosphatase [Parasphingopyxis sp.]
MAHTLTRLERIIHDRKDGNPSKSYVAKLFGKGRKKIAQKFGEESVETIVAALAEDDDALAAEAADALFHLLILLAERDVPLADVLTELERREGMSGLDERASRKS